MMTSIFIDLYIRAKVPTHLQELSHLAVRSGWISASSVGSAGSFLESSAPQGQR